MKRLYYISISISIFIFIVVGLVGRLVIIDNDNHVTHSTVDENCSYIVEYNIAIEKTPKEKYEIFKNTKEEYELTAYTLEEEGWTYGGIAADCVTKLYESNLCDRYIAVDKSIIPLGEKVYLEFPNDCRYIVFDNSDFDLNGIYTAVDTGSAIKGNIVDLYIGAFNSSYVDLAFQIGRQKVNLYSVKEVY